MNSYKNYIQEGSVYKLKLFSMTYAFLIIFGLLLFYCAFFVIDQDNLMGRNFSIFGGLFCIVAVILRMNGKFIIDKNQRKVTLKSTALAKGREFSFEDFSRFFVTKTSYLGFVTTNVSGEIYFMEHGKEKGYMMKQTFFVTRPVQRVIDETVEIMGVEH